MAHEALPHRCTELFCCCPAFPGVFEATWRIFVWSGPKDRSVCFTCGCGTRWGEWWRNPGSNRPGRGDQRAWRVSVYDAPISPPDERQRDRAKDMWDLSANLPEVQDDGDDGDGVSLQNPSNPIRLGNIRRVSLNMLRGQSRKIKSTFITYFGQFAEMPQAVNTTRT